MCLLLLSYSFSRIYSLNAIEIQRIERQQSTIFTIQTHTVTHASPSKQTAPVCATLLCYCAVAFSEHVFVRVHWLCFVRLTRTNTAAATVQYRLLAARIHMHGGTTPFADCTLYSPITQVYVRVCPSTWNIRVSGCLAACIGIVPLVFYIPIRACVCMRSCSR